MNTPIAQIKFLLAALLLVINKSVVNVLSLCVLSFFSDSKCLAVLGENLPCSSHLFRIFLKKSTVPPEVFHLKVTLLGTMPPIWRRLLVPANLTLAQLHEVLQAAMGWQNCHMHEFCAGHRHFGKPNPEDRLMGIHPVENERTMRLSNVLGMVGAKAIYMYDFGDSWEHAIVMEKHLPADPSTAYPVCTGGERACPPEDCGGIGGFYDLLDALGNPMHEQHDELQGWIRDKYDPDVFSMNDVNRMLMPLRRRRGNTSGGWASAW